MGGQEWDGLPKAAVDYIEAVIKHIKYRKKIRQDVRRELIAHFTDALADCQNDQERQKSAEDLIAGFGDVKVLGKLIRRGKKRCRPFWRTMVVRAFQGVGILFLLLVLYVAWFFSGKPIITTNYLEVMNQQVRPAADDSQNAWPLYEQAIQNYVAPRSLEPQANPGTVETNENPSAFDTSPRNFETLKELERTVLEQWLADNRQTIELIRQGNQKPYCWRTYSTGENGTTELIAVLLPGLSSIKEIAKLLSWQARWEAEQGRYEQAYGNVIECHLLGEHLRNKNILIEQLVAIAIESLSNETMRTIIYEYQQQITPEELNSFRNRFETIIGNEDFAVGFEGEKYFMQDEIQRCFTQTRIGGSHLYLQRINTLMPMLGNSGQNEVLGKIFQLLFTHPDREQTLQTLEEFYDDIEKWSVYSPASLKKQNININNRVNEIIKDNLFLGLLTPALEKVIQNSCRNRIDCQATLATVAIVQYQKQQGKLPESLEILVQNGLLKEVPIDPYSDQPLVYKKQGDGFTLYSVGANFTDDGGLPDADKDGNPRSWGENGDRVFWPVKN